MEYLVIVLVFALLLILTSGVIVMSIMIVRNNKTTIEKLLEQNAKNANDMNMRLIALTTEVILSSDKLTNSQVEVFEDEIKGMDEDTLHSIREQLANDSFDPFKKQHQPEPVDEISIDTSDLLNDSSSIVNK